MGVTTELIFDRRGKATKTETGTVEIRVTVNRRSQYLSTGVRVVKTEWKHDRIVNRPDSAELMDRLQLIKRKVEQEVNRCLENGEPIDLKRARDIVPANNEGSDFWLWMYERVEMMNVGGPTKSHYCHTLDVMQKWGKIQRWRDVTKENIYEWDMYIRSMKLPLTKAEEQRVKMGMKVEQRCIGEGAVHNYHKHVKRLLHIACDVGKIQQNPYDRMQGEFSYQYKGRMEYLTEEEMQRIMEVEIPDRLHREARDLFVFQMFTGMAYSDAMAFDIGDYKKVDGRWVRQSERIKTGVPFVSVLLPPVVEVLERNGMVLPHINNAEYNQRLKVVGMLAGIKTKLHSHLARHTFGTYMLSQGVMIEHVSKMMGHTNITMTQRYAKVLAQDVTASFGMVEGKLKGEKKKGTH